MSLSTVWEQQLLYNHKIKQQLRQYDQAEWTKEYLLGIVSEVDEVLREINWKKHRKDVISVIDKGNLAIEFADLTKLIFSLWQSWGFNEYQMLEYVNQKSCMLEFIYRQEQLEFQGRDNILMVDLDGTIADFRSGFLYWLFNSGYIDQLPLDPRTSLIMDQDLNWETADYLKWKDEFERSGGYADLLPFRDGIQFVKYAALAGWKIVVVTARPINISRIWFDSLCWLEEQDISPTMLWLENEQRISRAAQYKKAGLTVAALEDNPKYVSRYARAGIECAVRAFPYNLGIADIPNVLRTRDFTAMI